MWSFLPFNLHQQHLQTHERFQNAKLFRNAHSQFSSRHKSRILTLVNKKKTSNPSQCLPTLSSPTEPTASSWIVPTRACLLKLPLNSALLTLKMPWPRARECGRLLNLRPCMLARLYLRSTWHPSFRAPHRSLPSWLSQSSHPTPGTHILSVVLPVHLKLLSVLPNKRSVDLVPLLLDGSGSRIPTIYTWTHTGGRVNTMNTPSSRRLWAQQPSPASVLSLRRRGRHCGRRTPPGGMTRTSHRGGTSPSSTGPIICQS